MQRHAPEGNCGLPGRAAAGEARASAALARHVERVARGLAVIVNMLDPDVIVPGGRLFNMEHLYAELPGLIGRRIGGGARSGCGGVRLSRAG